MKTCIGEYLGLWSSKRHNSRSTSLSDSEVQLLDAACLHTISRMDEPTDQPTHDLQPDLSKQDVSPTPVTPSAGPDPLPNLVVYDLDGSFYDHGTWKPAASMCGGDAKSLSGGVNQDQTMQQATGLCDTEVALDEVDRLIDAHPTTKPPQHGVGGRDSVATQYSDVVGLMNELQPRGGADTLACEHAVVTHCYAMEALRLAGPLEQMRPDQVPFLKIAERFMKLHTRQLEALAKIRRGGQQTIRVEKVEISADQVAMGAFGGVE